MAKNTEKTNYTNIGAYFKKSRQTIATMEKKDNLVYLALRDKFESDPLRGEVVARNIIELEKIKEEEKRLKDDRK